MATYETCFHPNCNALEAQLYKTLILNPCCCNSGTVYICLQLNSAIKFIKMTAEYILQIFSISNKICYKYFFGIYFGLLMGLVERASWIYFGDRWMRRRESCLAVTTAPTMQCLVLYTIFAIFVQYFWNICTLFVKYLYDIWAILIFVQYLYNFCTKLSNILFHVSTTVYHI